MRVKINFKLLPVKGHYLFYHAGLVLVIPYLSVFARQLGFSATSIGMIYSTGTIISMFSKPIVGGIADKFRIKKRLFIIFQVLTACGLFPINYIPPLESEALISISCQGDKFLIDTSPKSTINIPEDFLENLRKENNEKIIFNIRCFLQINITMSKIQRMSLKIMPKVYAANTLAAVARVDNISISSNILSIPVEKFIKDREQIDCQMKESAICETLTNSGEMNKYLETRKDVTLLATMGEYQFWLFLLFFIIGWGSFSITISLADSICIEMIGDQLLYGKQRLFGAVGWGSFSIIGGFMLDTFSKDLIHKNYISVFLLMLVMMTISVICSLKIKYTQQKLKNYEMNSIKNVILQVQTMILLCWCLVVGMCTALFWTYLFWLIEDLAKHTNNLSWVKTIEGIAMVAQTLIGDVIFFFLSGCILRKIKHKICMSLILFVISIKFLSYTVIKNPWYIIPVEVLHGITFGLFYATMVSYAGIISPPEISATMQGLVCCMFDGIGVSLGSLIGGIILDQFEAVHLFLIFGFGVLTCAVLHCTVQIILRKREIRNNQDITT